MLRAQRRHHRRADREVGHEVAVHHVDVQQVGFGRHPLDLGREHAKSADRIDGAIFIAATLPNVHW